MVTRFRLTVGAQYTSIHAGLFGLCKNGLDRDEESC
jgi:hypothetical protein